MLLSHTGAFILNKQLVSALFTNPRLGVIIQVFAEGNMLQIISFAIFASQIVGTATIAAILNEGEKNIYK
jgi:hypothetical protein